jgi:formylglycine-generating enzyme required for sulfatase activity
MNLSCHHLAALVLAGAALMGRAAPGSPATNSLGMQFAPVPGTSVRFSIWETRVRDFAAFVDATGHEAVGNVYSLDPTDQQWKVHPTNTWRAPGFAQTPDHPVVNVSWNDIQVFCRWLTARERAAGRINARQEYRLPTDAEWSAAAGPAKFPWGGQWPPPPGAGNYWGTEHAGSKREVIAGYDDAALFTAPVGSHPPNAHGLYDLSGNVWEWCSDFYRKELNPEDLRRENEFMNNDAGGQTLRVMRGGGWVDATPRHLRSDVRGFGRPTNRYCTGFRVVLAPVEPAPPS